MQLLFVLLVLILSFGYAGWRIQHALSARRNPCAGCAGCALKNRNPKECALNDAQQDTSKT